MKLHGFPLCLKGSFQPVVYFSPNCRSEFREQTQGSWDSKQDVVQEDDVEVTQPVHAAEVANQIKVCDACGK